MPVHPLAAISPHACIGNEVSIGPFCVIEEGVRIGSECKLESHVVLKSGTTIGKRNFIGEGSVLGARPQHKNCPDKAGRLIVGDDNTLREHVTIHLALNENDATTVGNANLLMVNAHVGHDCEIGDNAIVANNAMIAGHVSVGDRAYVSGAVGIHQFCRVGQYAMIGGQAHIVKDVPPFVTVDGQSSKIVGLNGIGLKRAGVSANEIDRLKRAYRIAFRSGLRWDESIAQLREEFSDGLAAELHRFMSSTTRGCLMERRTPKSATISIHRHTRPSTGETPSELQLHDQPRAAS